MEECAQRFRVIPFDSLGGQQNSLLLGFRPDRVQVKYRGRTVHLSRVIVGGLVPGGDLSLEGSCEL